MAIEEIRIPFSVLRLLLPEDGEVQGFLIGNKNQWPQNEAKGPFESHEYAEVALGYKLRAQDKHKEAEGPWGPGIQDQGSYVHLQAGWRAHVAVPHHNDYFDGTLTARLTVRIIDTRLIPEVSHFDLKWNEDLWGKIITGVAKDKFDTLEESFERETVSKINRYLDGELRERFQALLDSDKNLRKLRDHTTVSVDGTTLILTIRTQ